MIKYGSFFKKILLLLLLFAISNIALGEQTVYLLQNITIQELQQTKDSLINDPKQWEHTIQELISNNHLIEITPEIAQEQFRIKWVNGGDELDLPRLMVFRMEKDVGYGLAALDSIGEQHIIAEYTGFLITNKDFFKPINNQIYAAEASYDQHIREVDAEFIGGAARFAQHLPSKTELNRYKFAANLARDKIAFENSGLYLTDSKHLVLKAKRKINPLEQIGFNYGPSYYWLAAPHFFDNFGNIIPRHQYQKVF